MKHKIFRSVLITSLLSSLTTAILIIYSVLLQSDNDIHIDLHNIAALMTIAALISLISANIVSRRIIRPIIGIDPDNPKTSKKYPELEPLLNRLREQNGRLNRQKKELGSRRDQFELITESLDEGMIIADKKLNILTCNSAALKLLGADELPSGQSIFTLNNTEKFRRCIQNAAGGRSSECILETADGGAAVIASPADGTDTLNGIFVLIIDVTERQKLEQIRREFTSNVSHELKTPLTSIYGMSDMLANGIVKAEDTAVFGEKIRDEADRLIKLTNDIMSLSQLDEAETFDIDAELDLYELSSEIMGRLSVNAAEKNVVLLVSGDHVIYRGNRMILDEIIYNLCDNAIKYNNEGGTVEIKLSRVRKNAVITVSDTGIGIPKEHTERIFERFYRVDKSRSRKIQGTGLGLSIVKHGVIYHGGSVSVKSIPEKGSVFTVVLPFHEQ